MAAEPEKKIEESLHAYARKRRKDAGAPLEMHRATRRMLQGEVAKLKAAQPPGRRAWWHSLFLVWPRFAAAVGMVAVLAVGVWVFTQSETRKSNQAGQVASRAAEDFAEFGPVKDRAEMPKETDGLAPSASTVEESARKLAEKRPVRPLDESKVRLRVGENTPALTPPAPVVLSEVARQKQEKQVAVRHDTPAQPMKLGDTLLAGSADDKSGDLNSVLLKQRAEAGRSYRVQDGRFVQLADSTATEKLGVYASSAITSAVTLEVGKPADTHYFSFQFPQTNFVGLFDDGAQQRLNLEVTNVLLDFDVTTYVGGLLAPASGPIAAATEWAANRQILARNEFTRERGLQPVSGVEIAADQKFERQDGAVPALLQKFELQQHANGRLSIHDADGTVYEGEILAAKTDSDTGNKAKAESDELQANRKLARTDDLSAAAAAVVSFRASGTNRNRELVVINGELLREEDQLGRAAALAGKNVAEPAGAVAEPATGLPVPSAPSAQPALKAPGQAGVNTRAPARFGEPVSAVNTSATVFVPAAIRGRVQIGKTNQLELRAIRSR